MTRPNTGPRLVSAQSFCTAMQVTADAKWRKHVSARLRLGWCAIPCWLACFVRCRAEDLHARAGGIAAAANAARQPATPASSSTPQPGTAPANDSNAQNPQAVADSNGTGPASNGNTHEGQPLAEQQQQGNEQARAENGDASGVAGTQQEGRAEQHTQQSSTFKALVDSVADNDNTHAANTKANSDPAAAPAPAQQGGNATGTSQVPGADDKGGEQPTAAGEGETPAAAADAATDPAADPVLPPRPSAAQLAAAHALAADVADCLKATVKPDVLMVVPALPFAPPLRRSDDPMEFVMFGKLTQAFHALATLGSCPTVTLPVGELRDGSPVAISVMAVYRYAHSHAHTYTHTCPHTHKCTAVHPSSLQHVFICKTCWSRARGVKRIHVCV